MQSIAVKKLIHLFKTLAKIISNNTFMFFFLLKKPLQTQFKNT